MATTKLCYPALLVLLMGTVVQSGELHRILWYNGTNNLRIITNNSLQISSMMKQTPPLEASKTTTTRTTRTTKTTSLLQQLGLRYTTPINQGCVKEDNFDYQYNDIYDGHVWAKTADACAKVCGWTRNCNFWTFEKNAPFRACWLKRSNRGKRGNNQTISGSKACGEDDDRLIGPGRAFILVSVQDARDVEGVNAVDSDFESLIALDKDEEEDMTVSDCCELCQDYYPETKLIQINNNDIYKRPYTKTCRCYKKLYGTRPKTIGRDHSYYNSLIADICDGSY